MHPRLSTLPPLPQVQGGSKCDLFDYTCAAKEKAAKEAAAAAEAEE
jgi:hypothetical protein